MALDFQVASACPMQVRSAAIMNPGYGTPIYPPRALQALTAVLFALLFIHPAASAQRGSYSRPPNPAHGAVLWDTGCVACHGVHGQGAPANSTEFKRPDTFPDFSRCDQTTPEPDLEWAAVIVNGGRGRGFSTIMPAFGKLLSLDDVEDLIAYMRGFCTAAHWPRGDLNLPRAIVTEKAFPEDEFVLSTAAHATGAPGFTTDYIHEERFGKANQVEVDLPQYDQDENHQWQNGPGDVTIGLKRVLWSSLRTGSIFALQGGVLPPTGNHKLGFGNGATTFEPFAAFDQLFPTNTWFQLQMGAELPRHPNITPQSVFFYSAIGQSLAPDHRLGRLWSPMVEFLATRDLKDGARTDWDVLPEMQVTLSRRQHIDADVGVRAPFTDTAGRSSQVYFYVLWDWQDGKFWEGW